MEDHENIEKSFDALSKFVELIEFILKGDQASARRTVADIIEGGWEVDDELWETVMLSKWE